MTDLVLLDAGPRALRLPTEAELVGVRSITKNDQLNSEFGNQLKIIHAQLAARSFEVGTSVRGVAERVNFEMLTGSDDDALKFRAQSPWYDVISDQPALVARATGVLEANQFYREFFGKDFSADPIQPAALNLGEVESEAQFVGALYSEELSLRRRLDVYPGAAESLKMTLHGYTSRRGRRAMERFAPILPDIIHLRNYQNEDTDLDSGVFNKNIYYSGLMDLFIIKNDAILPDSLKIMDSEEWAHVYKFGEYKRLIRFDSPDNIYAYRRRLIRREIYKTVKLFYDNLDKKKSYSNSYSKSLLLPTKISPHLVHNEPLNADFIDTSKTKGIVIPGLQGKLDAIDEFASKNPGAPVSGEIHRLLLGDIASQLSEGRAQKMGESSAAVHEPPKVAPAIWATMKLSDDTPPSFIKRHYQPWLGKGLARPDIKRLDPQLYVALNNWLRNNEMPADLDLPTLKEKNDRWVERVREGASPAPVDLKGARRLVDVASRRQSVDKERQ